MGAEDYLLSCSTCGGAFEMPEDCPNCVCVRPSRTNTPVCPPYESEIISVRSKAVPPPPSVPEIDGYHQILRHQRRRFRALSRRLASLEEAVGSGRVSFFKGVMVGFGIFLLLARFVACS
jgi:hypothetical protein